MELILLLVTFFIQFCLISLCRMHFFFLHHHFKRLFGISMRTLYILKKNSRTKRLIINFYSLIAEKKSKIVHILSLGFQLMPCGYLIKIVVHYLIEMEDAFSLHPNKIVCFNSLMENKNLHAKNKKKILHLYPLNTFFIRLRPFIELFVLFLTK